MLSEALKKFADELKTSREAKDITLHQIANRTKIDIKFLQAIENGDFKILPEIYIRAFIKEYVQTIDLDVNETMKRFELARQGKVGDNESNKTEIIQSEKTEDLKKEFDATETISQPPQPEFDPRIELNKMNIIIGSVVVFVFIILLYLIFVKPSSTEIVTEKPYNEILEGKKERFELNSPEVRKTTSYSTDSLHLSLLATNRVWVKVLTDKKEVFQNLIQANQELSFKAFKEFRVVVGNAGFIKLLLNNKPIENFGNQGEIKNIIITADTVKSYLISIPAKNDTASPTKN